MPSRFCSFLYADWSATPHLAPENSYLFLPPELKTWAEVAEMSPLVREGSGHFVTFSTHAEAANLCSKPANDREVSRALGTRLEVSNCSLVGSVQ